VKVLVGIQARSKSTRLPGKIFKEIFGRPMLERVWAACIKANVGDVRVLIPQNDKELEEWLFKRTIPYLAPEVPEDDLIQRYLKASEGYEGIVRVTSDCPLMEPSMIEHAVKLLEKNDYVCNTIMRTYPDGLDIQACKRAFLEWIDRTQTSHREHPFYPFDTNEMIRAGTGWKVGTVIDPSNQACLKISVDTEEDLKFVEKLCEARESKLVRPN